MDSKILRPAVFSLLVLLLSCEDPSEIGLVLTPDDQIVDGHRCGNFMTEYGIQTQDIHVTGRIVDVVRIKNFFRDGFSHGTPFNLSLYRVLSDNMLQENESSGVAIKKYQITSIK